MSSSIQMKQKSNTHIKEDLEIHTSRIESHGNLTLYNCIFVLLGGDLLDGGAIFLQGYIPNVFTKCHFRNCFSKNGGAIYISSFNKAKSFIQLCFFNNNNAYSTGGALYIDETNINIEKCEFVNNHINKEIKGIKESGAVFFNYSISNIENCTFSNNFILSTTFAFFDGCPGGSLSFYNSNYCLNSCSFQNNTIYCNDNIFMVYGGAIYSSLSNKSIINNCIFNNNSIVGICGISSGAGIFSSGDQIIIIENCSFVDNSLIKDVESSLGGALNFLVSNSSIKNCIFTNNKAFYGCDIFFTNENESFCNISNSIFEHNNCNENNGTSLFGSLGGVQSISFINNQVKILCCKEFFIFSSLMNASFLCEYYNNCIYPFDDELLQMNNVNLTDYSGLNEIEINDIFDKNCSIESSYYTSSLVFSRPNQFSESLFFSKSKEFLYSQTFSNSNDLHFTSTPIFKSNHFLNSKTSTENHNSDSSIFSDLIYKTNNNIIYSYSIHDYTISNEFSDIYLSLISHFLNPTNIDKTSRKKISNNIIVIILISCLAIISLIILLIIIILKNKRKSKRIYSDTFDDISFGI